MLHGLIQIYTGNGKGKTTAALGQGLRAVGCGLKVFMIQFLKSSDTGELHSCEKFDGNFKIFRFQKEWGFFWQLSEEQKQELKNEIDEALKFVQKVMLEQQCDILILDEVMGALNNKLIEEQVLCDLIRSKPKSMELILTGRNAPDSIIALADYVSEIGCVKHPMEKGIAARKGIEY